MLYNLYIRLLNPSYTVFIPFIDTLDAPIMPKLYPSFKPSYTLFLYPLYPFITSLYPFSASALHCTPLLSFVYPLYILIPDPFIFITPHTHLHFYFSYFVS